jgi:hypothetical protein
MDMPRAYSNPSLKVLLGRRFGKLVVLERHQNPASMRAFWLCRCDCGTEAVKMGKYLLNGDTRSCGCDQRTYRARGNHKHGDIIAKLDHKREYTIWRSMKSRCYTPSSSNYRFYGAKGVSVCDRWLSDFRHFIADMGQCPPDYTLDRINPSGNYEPDNCRWASWELQHKNLRKSKQPHAAA